MTSKFMKLNQLVVPMITLVLLVSQLTGCALFNREDTEKILEENEQVELVIPDKADTEENLEYTGSEKPYEVEADGDAEEEIEDEDSEIGLIEEPMTTGELESLFEMTYTEVNPILILRNWTEDQIISEEINSIPYYFRNNFSNK